MKTFTYESVKDVVVRAGITVLNLDNGTPDGIPGAPNAQPGYYPQRGDRVLCAWVDGEQPVVIGYVGAPYRGKPDQRVPAVHIDNAAPAGVGTAWQAISAGGWYAEVADGAESPDLWAVRGTTYTPPAPTGGVLVVAATGSSSWRDAFGGEWRSDVGSRVYQGQYGGYGNHKGLWYYPSMVAGLTGKTVTRLQIHVRRATSGGNFGGVPLQFWLHNYAGQPVGEPAVFNGPTAVDGGAPSIGATVDVDLPASWANQLLAGVAAGIAIHDPSAANYSILEGVREDPTSGTLSFTY